MIVYHGSDITVTKLDIFILLKDWILVLDSMLQRSALKQNDGQNVKHDCVEKNPE